MNRNANRREQLRRQQEAAARSQTTRRLVGVFAVLVALALVAILVFPLLTRSGTPATPAASPSAGAPLAAQVTPEGTSADGNALVVAQGRAGSPTVTLYLDYQCPNCRTFEEQFGPMLADTARAGEWTLQYKTMTFMDRNLSNTASTRAALAASCAADVGADTYAAYHDEVYRNQAARETRGGEGYSDELLRATIPATVGIAGEKLGAFQACYDGRATQDFVAKVNDSALADGVSGTPTLAVNGKPIDFKLVEPFTPDGLKAYLLANA